MSDKPKILDWHRTAADNIQTAHPPKEIWDVRDKIAEIIAAHDPHNETVYVPMYDDIHLALEDALGAEVTKLTAERDEARHLFESTDLHRGRLFSENNKLKAEVERLRGVIEDFIPIIQMHRAPDEDYSPSTCSVCNWEKKAAAALEGKDG